MYDLIACRAHLAEQGRHMESVNRDGWQRPASPPARPARITLAAWLLRLAARLDPALASRRREPAAALAPATTA